MKVACRSVIIVLLLYLLLVFIVCEMVLVISSSTYTCVLYLYYSGFVRFFTVFNSFNSLTGMSDICNWSSIVNELQQINIEPNHPLSQYHQTPEGLQMAPNKWMQLSALTRGFNKTWPYLMRVDWSGRWESLCTTSEGSPSHWSSQY